MRLLILHMLKGLPENGLYAPVALLYLDRLRRTQTRTRVARLWGGEGDWGGWDEAETEELGMDKW